MRTIDPNLNHGYYDESYLQAFGFDHLGINVKIHRTVMLPTAKGMSIGSNVEIGPYTVILCQFLTIGDNAKIGANCVFDGGDVEIEPDQVIPNLTSITGSPIEEEIREPIPRRRKR